MFHKVLLFVALLAMWLVLSGHYTWMFLVFGLVSSLLGVWMFAALPEVHNGFTDRYWSRLPRYSLWLFKEIAKSAWQVVKITIQPRMKLSPSLSWVPTCQRNVAGLVTFANSITLTPGTVCIMVHDHQMRVHALTKESIDELWDGEMDRNVHRVAKE